MAGLVAQGVSEAPIAVWAVDLSSADLRLQQEASVAIRVLLRRVPFRIRPVYLYARPPEQPDIHEWAQLRAEELAEGAGVPGGTLLPAELIEVVDWTMGNRVSELLAVAHRSQAQLIFVSTRGHGFRRWFFGSFADTLSLKSDVPVFIVNPHWVNLEWGKSLRRGNMDFEEVLFPTDLSDVSHEHFQQVGHFASQAGLKVTLFHKYGNEFGGPWDFDLVPNAGFDQPVNEELEEIRRKLGEWCKEGESIGVPTRLEIDVENSSLIDSLLRRSELTSCIVALAGKSTRIEAIMLGSVTRQMIRHAAAPVWILPETKQLRRPGEFTGR